MNIPEGFKPTGGHHFTMPSDSPFIAQGQESREGDGEIVNIDELSAILENDKLLLLMARDILILLLIYIMMEIPMQKQNMKIWWHMIQLVIYVMENHILAFLIEDGIMMEK